LNLVPDGQADRVWDFFSRHRVLLSSNEMVHNRVARDRGTDGEGRMANGE
jgi:hypothetical protein